jgi:hypothetical protein
MDNPPSIGQQGHGAFPTLVLPAPGKFPSFGCGGWAVSQNGIVIRISWVIIILNLFMKIMFFYFSSPEPDQRSQW